MINAVSTGFAWLGFTVFFLPIGRDLQLSRALVSLLFSGARLERGVQGPVSGWLIDRFGPRPNILIGCCLAGLGFILMARAQSFLTLALVYVFVLSLGFTGGFWSPVAAAINAWFIRYKSLALGVSAGLSALGGAGLVLALSFFIQQWGWRSAALAAGLVTWSVVLPVALVMHRSPESRGLYPDGRTSPPDPERTTTAALGTVDFTVNEALRTFSYWLLAASIAVRMLVTTGITVHLVPIMVWKGLPESTAGYLVSLLAFGGIATNFAFGWLGTRVPRTFLSGLGAMVVATGLVCLLIVPAPWGIYVFLVLLTFAEGSALSNWVLIGDFFGRRTYGTLMGLMAPIHSVGAFVSPIYAGWVYDRWTTYDPAVVTFSALIGLAGIMFFLLRRPDSSQPPRLAARPL